MQSLPSASDVIQPTQNVGSHLSARNILVLGLPDSDLDSVPDLVTICRLVLNVQSLILIDQSGGLGGQCHIVGSLVIVIVMLQQLPGGHAHLGYPHPEPTVALAVQEDGLGGGPGLW